MAGDSVDLLCQVLSAAIVVCCAGVRIPQIQAILKAGNTHGISLISLLIETWCLSMFLTYPCAMGYPVSSYLEFLFLTLQDFVLLYFVLKDRRKLTGLAWAGFAVYVSFLAVVAQGELPRWLQYGLVTSASPLSAVAKILQLWTIISNKDPGQVSALSWAISTCTAGSRMLTVVLQTFDMVLIVTSGQNAILNAALCGSIVYYRRHKQKQW